MKRDYQLNYSILKPSVFNVEQRERKAKTLVRVCQDFLQTDDLSALSLLDVGSSSGIIDNFLADYFGTVTGIDIDEPAMAHARETFHKNNLTFEHGDAMKLAAASNSLDVIVCSHVYEHVPDASQMFDEIYRALKPGGFCYFSGNNRAVIREPHHKLLFLSWLPKPLADRYMRLMGKGDHYHEKHVSFWSLKALCQAFTRIDYSEKVIADPEKFAVEYMLSPDTLKWRIARLIARYIKWATPHIWVLQKPPATGESVSAQPSA